MHRLATASSAAGAKFQVLWVISRHTPRRPGRLCGIDKGFGIAYPLVTALVLVGCAHLTPISRLTCSQPPAVRERPVATFAEAAAALDASRAAALASTRPQREYAAVLRLLRERRLDEVERPVVELVRSRDRDIARRAWWLMWSLFLTDRDFPDIPKASDRDQQVYLEALAHARSAERWSSSARPARQPLLTYTGDVVFLDVAINGRPA